MKVIGLKDKPKWRDILVEDCNGKLEECLHCRYSKAEKSIPKTNFTVMEKDENGNEVLRTISEIKIIRGSHDDIIGWSF